ncbi:TetR/AcrR family transcriptional regulator [Jatrophihabitans telluris]|uniref:TetR/AcrR family transcriptional regulator n=1 Tax=Jatrophihabitans telluris TaxID=2038343 RepID=A0ABY4QZQ1_9ACTN|nr:TetR/AcrR family transcriptional regulator [Jatrophihabitans telluris]UQX89074.1 TetR/AcrR family transcriptional regulator [Jatrophihabitans telluris]
MPQADSVAVNTASRPLRRDAEANRLRLLAAATQVFAEHGLDAGVDEVAHAAGVGMGTLYRRFPSKQALIDALVREQRLAVLALATNAAERKDGGGLHRFLLDAGQLHASQPACLQRLWGRSDVDPDSLTQIRAAIAELLADAQKHAAVRKEVTTTDITMIIWSLVAVIEATGTQAPNAWRRHLQLQLAGLRPSEVELTEPPVSQAAMTRVLGRR